MKYLNKTLVLTSAIFAVTVVHALDQDLPRVIWDQNPSSHAVIGYSSTAIGNVRYKVAGGAWQTANVDRSFTFDGSLRSHFVDLDNLLANTEVQFQICNSTCGDTYWFKTAPNGSADMTFIAGGDSRTYRNARQEGNRVVSRVRPEFVMFGGDFTDRNRYYELEEWLEDWQLTFSNDTIDGQPAKRVYPIIPTVGNHENDDQKFICEVFGVDRDNDNRCTLNDTYFAMNIGQVRAYTLNTEFRLSGYSAYWSQQSSWLRNDLAGNTVTWKVAQYHKPMYPRTTTKPSQNSYMVQWADDFTDYDMNLVVESDSHLVKYTYPVVASSNGYQRNDSAGTVYIGEGSWGAPTRPADRSSSWIADQDSFGQLKVIQTVGNELHIRTVPFSGNAFGSGVSKAQRDANPLALPILSLWQAANVGDVYVLEKASNGLSRWGQTSTPTPTPIVTPAPDLRLQNGKPANGSVDRNEFDIYVVAVPASASTLTVTLSGNNDADLYVRRGSKPTTANYDCRPYIDGSNESCEQSNSGNNTWYVGVRGYSANVSTYSVVATWSSDSVATPTPVITPQPTATPIVTPIVSCTGENWDSNSIYNTGDKAIYNGNLYEAQWWNRGANPAQNSGSWAVWQLLDC